MPYVDVNGVRDFTPEEIQKMQEEQELLEQEQKDNPEQYEGDLLSRVSQLEEQVLTLTDKVHDLELSSGGSVLPGPGTDPNPGFKPKPGGSTIKPGGGLTVGG